MKMVEFHLICIITLNQKSNQHILNCLELFIKRLIKKSQKLMQKDSNSKFAKNSSMYSTKTVNFNGRILTNWRKRIRFDTSQPMGYKQMKPMQYISQRSSGVHTTVDEFKDKRVHNRNEISLLGYTTHSYGDIFI